MKIVKNIFKNFLRKKKNWSNTGKKAPSKMMEIQKFLAFFLTLYTVKTNCDMLNKKGDMSDNDFYKIHLQHH